jgi:hypothetical protein
LQRITAKETGGEGISRLVLITQKKEEHTNQTIMNGKKK